jgi:hypothetical protein
MIMVTAAVDGDGEQRMAEAHRYGKRGVYGDSNSKRYSDGKR